MSEEKHSPSPEFAIQVKGLKKSFGLLDALRGIEFELKQGEFLTIFGPNGAGKTTLLKILSSLTQPTSGSAFVAGYDVLLGEAGLRREIGVISHASCLYEGLTAYENILFYAKMYNIDDPETRSAQVIDEVGLKPRMYDRVHTFSRGMLQRLSIARAVVHDPSVLFLDEPFTGLDQHATKVFQEQLASLHTKKRTVIMTTHDLARGLETCDRVAIQVRGKFAVMESVDSIDKNDFERLYFKTVEAGR